MSSVVAAPTDWLQSVGELRFSSKADRRLQDLMERNNEGRLSESEREELATLAELSEPMALVRAGALGLLRANAA